MYEYDYSDPCLESRCLLVLFPSVICINCKRGNISRLVEGKQSIKYQLSMSSRSICKCHGM